MTGTFDGLIGAAITFSLAILALLLLRRNPGFRKPVETDFNLAIRRIWILGAAGAVVIAGARTLKDTQWTWTLEYLLDVTGRFSLLAWIGTYYAVNSSKLIRADTPSTAADVGFDVIQSVLSFTAISYLGFWSVGGFTHPREAYLVAYGSIFIICVGALAWFRATPSLDGRSPKAMLNSLRLGGAAITLVGAVYSLWSDQQSLYWLPVLVFNGALLTLVFEYVRERRKRGEAPTSI